MNSAHGLRAEKLHLKIKDGNKAPEKDAQIVMPRTESMSYKALKADMDRHEKVTDTKLTINNAAYKRTLFITALALSGMWLLGAIGFALFGKHEFTLGLSTIYMLAVFTPLCFVWSVLSAFLLGQKTNLNFEDLDALPNAVETYSAKLEDTLKRSRLSVSQSLYDIQEQQDVIENVTSRIQNQISKIRALSVESLSIAQNTADVLERETTRADERLKARQSSLEKLGLKIVDSVKGAERYGLSAAARMTKTLSLAKTETNMLSDVLSGVTNRFEDTVLGAKAHIGDLIGQSRQHTLDLDQAGANYDERIKSFDDTFSKRIAELEKLIEKASAPSIKIEQAINDAEDRYKNIEERLGQFNAELDKKRASVMQDIEQSRTEAFKQVEILQALSKDVNTSYANLNTAASIAQFDDLLRRLSEAEDKLEALEKTAVSIRSESDKMSRAAETTSDKIQDLSIKTKGAIDDVLKTSEQKLTAFYARGETIAKSTQITTNALQSALKATDIIGKDMMIKLAKLSETAQVTGKTIKAETSALDNQIKALEVRSVSVGNRLKSISKVLSEKTGDFMNISTAALDAAFDAGEKFKKYGENLLKHTATAKNTMREIQGEVSNIRAQETYEAGEFILEALYSTAVDLVRLTDGGVSEKLWTSYQHGQKEVFAKAMLSLADDIPMNELQKKYKNDSEFRTAIVRYIERFEDFVHGFPESAQKGTHGSLLYGAIITSDVAKLYNALCRISEKTNKITH